jgi:hypothetical protein
MRDREESTIPAFGVQKVGMSTCTRDKHRSVAADASDIREGLFDGVPNLAKLVRRHRHVHYAMWPTVCLPVRDLTGCARNASTDDASAD